MTGNGHSVLPAKITHATILHCKETNLKQSSSICEHSFPVKILQMPMGSRCAPVQAGQSMIPTYMCSFVCALARLVLFRQHVGACRARGVVVAMCKIIPLDGHIMY